MSWMWGLFGAILGLLVTGAEFFGLVFGIFLGVLFGRQSELSRKLDALTQAQGSLPTSPVARPDADRMPYAAATARTAAADPPPTPPQNVWSPSVSTQASEAADAAASAPSQATPPVPPSSAAEAVSDQAVPDGAASAPASVWVPDPGRDVERDPWANPEAFRAEAGEARGSIDSMGHGPDLASRLGGVLKRWFTEGNVPVKLGVPILFFGVAYFLRYAAAAGWVHVTIEWRLLGVALAALAALVFAWRKRLDHRVFSLSLQGGALGVLLIDVFAGFRYGVLPVPLAFPLALLMVAGCGALALLQNAMALAVLGLLGGFLAPVLLSTGSGNHVALFSYYAVLNALIFFVAWRRPWRVLNLLGFLFTFVIGGTWGWRSYRPEHFATTEPFLILFFLFFLGISLAYALHRREGHRGWVDGTLVFGVPLVAFGMQAGLLRGEPMPLAWSALAVAALYALLARMLHGREGLQTLVRSFAALGLGFATLAVPLALDADLTAAVWAIEGAAVFWLGLRQHSRRQLFAGLALQAVGLIAWWFALVFDSRATQPMLLNGVFWAGVLQVAALLCSAFCWERARDRHGPGDLLIGLAGLVWCAVVLAEVEAYLVGDDKRIGVVAAMAATLLAVAALRRMLQWPRIGAWAVVGLALTPLLVLAGWTELQLEGRSLLAWLGWLLAAAAVLWTLREPLARGVSYAHVSALLAVAGLLGNELHVGAQRMAGFESAWAAVGLILPLCLMTLALLHTQRIAWPLHDWFAGYRLRWWLPAAALLGCWWFLSLFHDGAAAPIAFVPLLNPLELMQLLVAVVLFVLAGRAGVLTAELRFGFALSAWIWLSVVLARALHHLGGLEWNDRMWHEGLLQAGLTTLWGLLGATAWVVGSRRLRRPLWLAGAVLLGVVFCKLVLIDRRYMGEMAGIVAVLGFGALLVIVGYLAPSPPRKQEEPA